MPVSYLYQLSLSSQVSSLDDIKTFNQGDNNAAKTIALDHLGVIAARIRSSAANIKTNEPSKIARNSTVSNLQHLDEVKWTLCDKLITLIKCTDREEPGCESSGQTIIRTSRHRIPSMQAVFGRSGL